LSSISSLPIAFPQRRWRKFKRKHAKRFCIIFIINKKYIFLSYEKILGYEKTMSNLGILYNIFPNSYRVALLSAIAHEGSLDHFQKYGFVLNKDELNWARKRQGEGKIIPYELSEKRREIIDNKRKYYENIKHGILQFLEKNCEKSSIPLLDTGIFFVYFCKNF
jgi:hypothetical protein